MKTRKKEFFDSMASAASGLRISLELVRRAKKAGCHAFRGGRVESEELRRFIAENEKDLVAAGADGLKEQKMREEIRGLKLKFDKMEGLLVSKAEIANAIRRALSGVSSIIESKIVNEWPAMVSDNPEAARVYGRRLHDMVMAECQKLAKEFPE